MSRWCYLLIPKSIEEPFFEPGLFSFSETLKTFSIEQMPAGFRSGETLKMLLMDSFGTLHKVQWCKQTAYG